jgi:hypothetical protein
VLVTGVGVGLTLPTLMATAAASLPPRAFATGSAVVNMLRQVGVALLVALLGPPASSAAALTAFRTGWLVLAAIAVVAAVVAAVVLRARAEAPALEVRPAVPPVR